MEIVLFALIWAFVNVAIANAKNRSGVGAFFGSILITPLLVSIYLIAVPARDKASQESRGRYWCPVHRKYESIADGDQCPCGEAHQ